MLPFFQFDVYDTIEAVTKILPICFAVWRCGRECPRVQDNSEKITVLKKVTNTFIKSIKL